MPSSTFSWFCSSSSAALFLISSKFMVLLRTPDEGYRSRLPDPTAKRTAVTLRPMPNPGPANSGPTPRVACEDDRAAAWSAVSHGHHQEERTMFRLMRLMAPPLLLLTVLPSPAYATPERTAGFTTTTTATSVAARSDRRPVAG